MSWQKPDHEWLWAALDMRKAHATYPEIAEKLGVPKSTVKWWVSGRRHIANSQAREKRDLARQARGLAPFRAPERRPKPAPDVKFVVYEPHQPRVIRAVINRDAIPAAAAAFAAGLISRAELMAAIDGRAR